MKFLRLVLVRAFRKISRKMALYRYVLLCIGATMTRLVAKNAQAKPLAKDQSKVH